MEIKIKQLDTGIIYSSDMSDSNKHSILEMNFCTSYTEAVVQDERDGTYPTHSIILPPIGTSPNWVDMTATQEEALGEWVEEEKARGGE